MDTATTSTPAHAETLSFEERYVHLNTQLIAELRQRNYAAALTYADAVLQLCSSDASEAGSKTGGRGCPAAETLLSMRAELQQLSEQDALIDNNSDASSGDANSTVSSSSRDSSTSSCSDDDDAEDEEGEDEAQENDGALRSADVAVVLAALLKRLPPPPDRTAATAAGTATAVPPRQNRVVVEEREAVSAADELILNDIQKEVEVEMRRLAIARKNR